MSLVAPLKIVKLKDKEFDTTYLCTDENRVTETH